ncbi:HpcH/HpaI aldolase family protein [Sneathiella chinensis]|uniref:4-hydroxy-2-oxovalerate aldolase n=1 Tax=Sneathiella chinensis TaxID=349750 RepID=A0ABQ5U213_9PROT|nr:aldolase/citrate lyase family protein [Sneathiella chinensis]GLQ05215.1 4-hydroxy-2-oxovalerate aldolase [Sneathiella chinensis]
MKATGRLAETLARGGKATGCWLFSGSAEAADILGASGFDMILIDHEHGTGTLPEAINQLRAVRAAGDSSALIRLTSHDPADVKRALDAGMEGIMFPCVNTAAEARAIVDACYFPPKGKRGAGMGATRASGFGLWTQEYLSGFEQKLFVICQIESAEAVGNIEEIAAVDGVDMLFIGPADLSGSIGKLGQFDDPEVKALFEEARDRIRATGKPLGCVSKGPENTLQMFAEGFDLLLCASDTGFMADGAGRLLDQLKT